MNNILNLCFGMFLQAVVIVDCFYWVTKRSWLMAGWMFLMWLFAGRGIIWRAQTMGDEGVMKGIEIAAKGQLNALQNRQSL